MKKIIDSEYKRFSCDAFIQWGRVKFSEKYTWYSLPDKVCSQRKFEKIRELWIPNIHLHYGRLLKQMLVKISHFTP